MFFTHMEKPAAKYRIDLSARYAKNTPQLIAEVSPCQLFELFDYPLLENACEGNLGTYIFVSELNDVIAMDYLADNVWQLFVGVLRKRFWRSREMKRLVIEAEKKEIADAFSAWLSAQVRCKICDWP